MTHLLDLDVSKVYADHRSPIDADRLHHILKLYTRVGKKTNDITALCLARFQIKDKVPGHLSFYDKPPIVSLFQKIQPD